MNPGAIIAKKYRLEAPLARGGMGAVWTARHVALGHAVAVKFLDPRLAGSSSFVARFEREARAAATAQSPHIVRVHDFGFEEGTPYLVMELLRGEDLRSRIRRMGRLPLSVTAGILVQVGKGLRRAHEYGDDSAMAITGRMNTAALKLAMILAAVNGRWGHISAETMRAAIWLADLYRLNTWRLLTERSKHGVGGHKLAKALDVIVRRGGAPGCTRSTVMQYANMKAHELRPVLERLLQLGAVIESDDGKRLRAVHTKLPAKAYV